MENTTYLNFHYGQCGCINIYAKCLESVANQFIENLPILNKHVMLIAVDGAGCSNMIKDVLEIKIKNKIVMHNFRICSLYDKDDCDDYYGEDYSGDNSIDENDLAQTIKNKKTIHTDSDIFLSRNTDLFESIMMDSIRSMIHVILKMNTVPIYENKYITKIILVVDNKELEIDIPVMKYHYDTHFDPDMHPFLEAKNRSDLHLINIINNVVEIYKYAKKNKTVEKTLVFSGYSNIKKNIKKPVEKGKMLKKANR